MTTICVFGDSIAWGAVDPECGGWVPRLRKYFDKLGYNFDVYNCSVSGDKTNDLLQRFKIEAKARAPNVIIFAIGINDTYCLELKDNLSKDSTDFERNLKALKDQAEIFTNKIIFVGLTHVDESKTNPRKHNNKIKFYDSDTIAKYDSIIKDFCAGNKLIFIEMIDLLNNEDLEDGLHPNTRGHKKMFDRIKKYLVDKNLLS